MLWEYRGTEWTVTRGSGNGTKVFLEEMKQ